LRILFLAKEGRYQPGDCVALPFRDAERLVKTGRAEPALLAQMKSVANH
jgi:hypothetical protein